MLCSKSSRNGNSLAAVLWPSIKCLFEGYEIVWWFVEDLEA